MKLSALSNYCLSERGEEDAFAQVGWDWLRTSSGVSGCSCLECGRARANGWGCNPSLECPRSRRRYLQEEEESLREALFAIKSKQDDGASFSASAL